MAKTRKGARRRSRRNTKKRSGGGYGVGPAYIAGAPGYSEINRYDGPGKDCAGADPRPGYIGSALPGAGGLPGVSRGGATQLGSGGPVITGFRGYTTGAAAELAQMAPAPAMRGGRYGTGELAPLSSNGVGTTPGSIMRLPCEAGTYNPLNPNPRDIQTATTAVGYVPGWTPFAKAMGGGKRRKSRKSGGAFPVVHVGAADSMRYYAPTAGYSNNPLAPPVLNNPGILMQTPYDARAFNMACLKTGGGNIVTAPLVATETVAKTGGSRAKKEEEGMPEEAVFMGGAVGPVAAMAGKFEPVTMADYAGGILPVKFGGDFSAFNPAKLPMTSGLPVAAQAGAFGNEQRIPTGHYIPGSSVNSGPVSRPAAGGARKMRRRKAKSSKH
jgi:hypothetical protein